MAHPKAGGEKKHKMSNPDVTSQVVQLLLDRGANKDLASPHGLTPLRLAALNGHVEVVKLLLEAPGRCWKLQVIA